MRTGTDTRYGAYATKDIKPGSTVGVYPGQIHTFQEWVDKAERCHRERFAKMEKQKALDLISTYSMSYGEKGVIDPTDDNCQLAEQFATHPSVRINEPTGDDTPVNAMFASDHRDMYVPVFSICLRAHMRPNCDLGRRHGMHALWLLGAWCLMLGAWCLVLGAWCLVLGARSVVPSAWFNAARYLIHPTVAFTGPKSSSLPGQ